MRHFVPALHSRHIGPLLTLLLACGAGCYDEPFPFDASDDTGAPDSGIEDQIGDVATAEQRITFITPDPADRRIASGIYTVVFRYEDDAGLGATVSIGYVRQAEVEPTVIEIDGPGEYSVDMDTTGLTDGNESFIIKAVSSDGRQLSARGKILLDNNPPVIEILDPTPAEGAGFVDELPIRVRVTDSGSLVHFVRITTQDFEWVWPPVDDGTGVAEPGPSESGDVLETVETGPAGEVDTRTIINEKAGTYEDLVIPTTGWRGGDIVLTVTAGDGVEGRDVVVSRQLIFVERPGFDGGQLFDMDLGAESFCEEVQGIRLGPADDGDWALMASIRDRSGYRLDLFKMDPQGSLQYLSTVLRDSCPVRKIIDMNGDGMDDILAFCGLGDQRRIIVLEQTEGLEFVQTKTMYTTYAVNDIAAGDLNEDGVLDLAFVTTVEPLWTGIMLSSPDAYGSFSGYAAPTFYSGAVRPNHVAIGRFSDDQHNAVVVGANSSGLVTAYPIDENGIPSMGENSSLDPDNELIDDVSDMVAVNFSNIRGQSDALVVADSKGSEVLGIAKLRQDESRRVESVNEWPIGRGAKKVALGDINDDGSPDVTILCPGSNMVAVFMGKKLGEYSDPVDEKAPVLVGPATDMTLVDVDMDGFLDIVLLMGRQQLKVIYYREKAGAGWFDGSHQALVPQRPMSLAAGHFVKPLTGAGADFLDVAVLYLLPGATSPNAITVYSSDEVSGLPTHSCGEISLHTRTATSIVPGNFDIDLAAGGGTAKTRPTDLIVPTGDIPSDEKPFTAYLVAFEENTHQAVFAVNSGLVAGTMPEYAAVGEFDLDSTTPAAMDVAFLSKMFDGDYRDRELQVMLGNMERGFSTTSSAVGPIAPISMGWINQPMLPKSYPLRRSLKNFLAGKLSQDDMMVINHYTRDITLLINDGFGLFRTKELGSHDFSAAGQPVDVTAGYLRARVDDKLTSEVASNQLPDLVTLLSGNVLIDYSLDKQTLKEIGEDIGFEAPVVLATAGRASVAVAVADMNVDGMYDIVVLDSETSTIQIIPNLGQRRFAEPYVFSAGKTPIAMVVADVDADGCPDVVTADSEGKTTSTLHNQTPSCLDQE